MTTQQINELVSRISFRDWKFIVKPLGDGSYVQVMFQDKDTDNGQDVIIRGRKWYVSPYAIEDEVVKTCWMAVEAALKHEAMESFLVDGRAPFHPHNDSFEMAYINKVYRAENNPEPETDAQLGYTLIPGKEHYKIVVKGQVVGTIVEMLDPFSEDNQTMYKFDGVTWTKWHDTPQKAANEFLGVSVDR